MLAVGGLNLLLVGLFNFDLVATLFGLHVDARGVYHRRAMCDLPAGGLRQAARSKQYNPDLNKLRKPIK